ncbi:hypothetical protein KDN32_17705 [Nocardioides sp. J2M5]|uniref:hypothetical protein n=1 Tax=Nocardioides palaemonis TaxID=2829810 RepID=UPI001BA964AC|nr:hypothetical protein [Nocardioides palaemonis]MBS2939578.1 hypothetical protein [Nocardioides palaemonis]
MSDQSTTTETPKTPDSVNELTELGEFIQNHGTTTFDGVIGTEVKLIGLSHESSEDHCSASHYPAGEGWVCDEYERGLHIGIAWLKDQVELHGARAVAGD